MSCQNNNCSNCQCKDLGAYKLTTEVDTEGISCCQTFTVIEFTQEYDIKTLFRQQLFNTLDLSIYIKLCRLYCLANDDYLNWFREGDPRTVTIIFKKQCLKSKYILTNAEIKSHQIVSNPQCPGVYQEIIEIVSYRTDRPTYTCDSNT